MTDHVKRGDWGYIILAHCLLPVTEAGSDKHQKLAVYEFFLGED